MKQCVAFAFKDASLKTGRALNPMSRTKPLRGGNESSAFSGQAGAFSEL